MEVVGEQHALGKHSGKCTTAWLFQCIITYFGELKNCFCHSDLSKTKRDFIDSDIRLSTDASGRPYSGSTTAEWRGSSMGDLGHRAAALDILRKMQTIRSSNILSATLSLFLSAFDAVFSRLSSVLRSRRPPPPPPPLSRREVMDATNAVETLSLLLVKSLREDTTGQTYHFYPCALCSLLSMSVAINTFLEAALNSQGHFKPGRLKLCKTSLLAVSSEFPCGEMQMLQLAVEEAVLRVVKTKAHILQKMTMAMRMTSTRASASVMGPRQDADTLPKALAAELQRISSM